MAMFNWNSKCYPRDSDDVAFEEAPEELEHYEQMFWSRSAGGWRCRSTA